MDSARSSFAADPTSTSRAATSKPLDRYFPELHQALLDQLPEGCVIDGEIVITTPRGLDFDALQLRLHPAASRVAKLAKETPASFVAFDLLAVEGRDLMAAPQRERRERLERLLAGLGPPLSPHAHDPATAAPPCGGSTSSRAPASTA